jgi:glutathione S-transferase
VTVRIYGYAASINVRKVLWACDEIGISYVREDWGGGHRSTSQPAFRALNPVAMVPVLDDGGHVLWESNTIVRYLAASRARIDLLPTDPLGRAHIEKWMDWQASDLNDSWRYAFQALVRRRPEFADPDEIRRSIDAFTRMIAVVDARVRETGAYIAGDAFTVADIAIGLSVHRWNALPVDRPAFDHVARYTAMLCQRPAFAVHGRDGGS